MAQVFGREVNEACVKAGQDILKKAKEAHQKKKEDANKGIADAAKDIAHGLVAKSIGRLNFIGDDIRCHNIMSNADRRERSMSQDRGLEDYKEEVVHAEKCK
jgi:hypothetical protein